MAYLQFGVAFKNVGTSSTAKTVAGIKPAANQAVKLLGTNIGCDGTNSANGPAIIELNQVSSWGTDVPGTGSSSVTPVSLDSGRPETVQATAGSNWTGAEPSTENVIETFYVPSYMGSAVVFRPLTVPIVAKGGGGLAMRVTQQSGVTPNVSGSLTAEE